MSLPNTRHQWSLCSGTCCHSLHKCFSWILLLNNNFPVLLLNDNFPVIYFYIAKEISELYCYVIKVNWAERRFQSIFLDHHHLIQPFSRIPTYVSILTCSLYKGQNIFFINQSCCTIYIPYSTNHKSNFCAPFATYQSNLIKPIFPSKIKL